MELVLASQSPRRQQLLQGTGVKDFIICPALGEEVIDPTLSPSALVEALATQKAEEVQQKYPDKVILGADTLVVLGSQVMGKPKNQEEAVAMITALSQAPYHQVLTGVCLLQGEKRHCYHQETKVFFRPLTSQDILRYVSLGESLDKAGAYSIQGAGALLVESLEGDYYNVMGLPLCSLAKGLEQFGLPLWGEKEEG